MQKSESIAALAGALAKAQAQILGAKKDSENPFFKSKYADLAAVWDACRDALTKNELSIVQTPRTEITEGATVISVGTLLAHSSGEWVFEELSAAPVRDDPQGIGSCVTYLRRYALSAFTGVAPEDDDGNAASQGNGTHKLAKAKPRTAEDTEREAMFHAIKAAGNALNKMGDAPEWTLSRANAFANENFNTDKGVDGLTLPQLAEMAKLMSARIDDLKKDKRGKKADSKEEAERQAKLQSILKHPEQAVAKAMQETYPDQSIQDLTLDQLIHLEDEIIPF